MRDEKSFSDLLSAEDYPLCIYPPNWTEEEYDSEPMEELGCWLDVPFAEVGE